MLKNKPNNSIAITVDLYDQQVSSKIAIFEKEGRSFEKRKDILIYPSKGRENIKNYNGCFFDRDQNPILCRQISLAFLEHDKQIFPPYQQAFNNLNKIPFLYNNHYDKKRLHFNAAGYVFINIQNIGKELANLAEGLTENSVLKMEFNSENHAMSIKIKRKKEGFILIFFDPTITTAHLVIFARNAASFQELSIDNVINNSLMWDGSFEPQNYYFPSFEVGYLSIQRDKFILNSPDAPFFKIGDGVSNVVQLYFSLWLGLSKSVSSVIQAILNANDENKKEMPTDATPTISTELVSMQTKEQLAAITTDDGSPGLWVALQNGHHEAVTAYIEGVIKANLGIPYTYELLKAMWATEGLWVALINGHYETVAAYIEGVIKANLGAAVTYELLRAIGDKKVQRALLIVMKKGDYETITTYIEGVIRANLGPKLTYELLAAVDDKKLIPALWIALQKGHHKTVFAYIEGVIKANLGPELTYKLLAAIRGKDAVPGLLMALQEGHHETVTAYIQGVIKANLGPELTKQLIAAIGGEEAIPGLFMALQNGHHETVTAYIQGIIDANLGAEFTFELLAAIWEKNNTTGFFNALQNGHHKTVTTYIDGVIKANLGPELTYKLLAAIWREYVQPGLLIALQKGYLKTVAAYIEGVLKANLGLAFIKKLLVVIWDKDAALYGLLVALQDGNYKAITAFIDSISKMKTSALISAQVNPAILKSENREEAKKEIIYYLKFVLNKSSYTTHEKIHVFVDAINQKGQLGSILYTANSPVTLSFLKFTQPRLTAGNLKSVINLIKEFYSTLSKDERDYFQKQLVKNDIIINEPWIRQKNRNNSRMINTAPEPKIFSALKI